MTYMMLHEVTCFSNPRLEVPSGIMFQRRLGNKDSKYNL